MIKAADFITRARAHGFEFYAGVPCSFLTPFINQVIDSPTLTYISSANEGDAVATVAGAFLAGTRGVAMMQNSGLGNAVSPLTSLAYVFRIPMLVICTHRGAPGVADEPQHELMGQITIELFDVMRIPSEAFPDTLEKIDPVLARATNYMATERRPYALIMQKGAVESRPLENRSVAARDRCQVIETLGSPAMGTPHLSRATVLDEICAHAKSDSIVIATTGFTGRELYATADRPNHFYMVGSMGCASSLGLGLALRRPDLRVIVVDGDGAALMRMGNFATLGSYGPSNLYHVLLDNEAHDSTGAQATVSANVDFAEIAKACGYSRVIRGYKLDALHQVLKSSTRDGPNFLHLKIATGTLDNLPRPSLTPTQVLDRLRLYIGANL